MGSASSTPQTPIDIQADRTSSGDLPSGLNDDPPRCLTHDPHPRPINQPWPSATIAARDCRTDRRASSADSCPLTESAQQSQVVRRQGRRAAQFAEPPVKTDKPASCSTQPQAGPDFVRVWELRELLTERHQPNMLVRDLDRGEQLTLLIRVFHVPDPEEPPSSTSGPGRTRRGKSVPPSREERRHQGVHLPRMGQRRRVGRTGDHVDLGRRRESLVQRVHPITGQG